MPSSASPSHRFKVGQTVRFAPSKQSMPSSGAVYKVVRLMPADGEDYIYRVKAADEPFERVAKERELSETE